MPASGTPRARGDDVFARAHVLVAGAGGIGCPASLALVRAGVGRLTVVDPDRVELSNLPRQVLYGTVDVGRPKAEVASERLREGSGTDVHGAALRLDETTEDALLDGVDLVIDATDGAWTKDWINQLAVRRRLPLVHAAGLRSEGRLLDVPAGGAPCLACLFGRLEEDQGRCADLGVWNGVVGAIGFLAAATALRRLADPDAPSRGYAVLDLEGGRALTLSARGQEDCPVCGPEASRARESLRRDEACAPDSVGRREEPPGTRELDLRDEACPMNLLRARRAVEDLGAGEALVVRLGGEGVLSVPDGLRALGHHVREETPEEASTLRLVVERGARALTGRRLERDDLLRFARQVVLPELGESGQLRLLAARVIVRGAGPAADTAVTYLRCAGVGEVARELRRGGTGLELIGGDAGEEPRRLRLVADPEGGVTIRAGGESADDPRDALDEVAAAPLDDASARSLGALLADRASREIALPSDGIPPGTVRVRPGGVVESA